MALRYGTGEKEAGAGELGRRASEAAELFRRACAEETARGGAALTATARKNGSGGEEPLVLDSVEDAERVKKLILEELAPDGFKRVAAMVYKDGPFYRHVNKRGKVVENKNSEYFLIKIKISASW